MTETTTEYKEATDDSDFSDFGANNDFPSLLTEFSNSSRPFQLGPEGLQGLPSTKATTESSSSSDDEDEGQSEEKFQKEALEAHNEYRTKHRVGPLKLDKKVSHIFIITCSSKHQKWVLLCTISLHQ